MLKAKITILSVIFCALLGCKKSNVTTPPTEQTGIIGRWNWIESVGEIGVRTPQTEGYSEVWWFGVDSSLKVFRNDTLKYQSSFRIFTQERPFGLGYGEILQIEGYSFNFAITYTDSDTLTLTGLSLDVEYSKFIRMKGG